MLNLKKLKKDVEQMYLRTSCGNQHSLDLARPTLSEVLELIKEVLELIKEHEALLKQRGYDKLEAVSVISNFLFECEYEIADTKKLACDLVNNLNKHGYTIVKKDGKKEKTKQLTAWCETCVEKQKQDEEYCLVCVDKSLEGISVPKPSRYKGKKK